jgi:protein-S-isoprenylcysteine O-methyltransferase Ste14
MRDNSFKMKDLGKQIIFFIIFYLIYQNIFYILIIPDIYSNSIYVIYLITAYIITLGDTVLRSIPQQRHDSKLYSLLILSMVLLSPFFLIAAYYENLLLIVKFIPFWDSIIIVYIGFVLYLFGGLVIIIARAQIGRFGTGELIVEEDHELFVEGVYTYIRNPMYSGSLIATVGFCLIFRCIIILFVMFIYYFLIFRMRILEEERILEEKFGQQYEDYKKKTKRLIPFLY